MTDAEQPENTFLDVASAGFMERCAAAWERQGLPLNALAGAAVTWGLQLATLGEGPEAVAEGLERMAAAIREAGDPLGSDSLH